MQIRKSGCRTKVSISTKATRRVEGQIPTHHKDNARDTAGHEAFPVGPLEEFPLRQDSTEPISTRKDGKTERDKQRRLLQQFGVGHSRPDRDDRRRDRREHRQGDAKDEEDGDTEVSDFALRASDDTLATAAVFGIVLVAPRVIRRRVKLGAEDEAIEWESDEDDVRSEGRERDAEYGEEKGKRRLADFLGSVCASGCRVHRLVAPQL